MTWIHYIPQQDGLQVGSFFDLESRKSLDDAIRIAKEYSAHHLDCPVRVLQRELTVVWEPDND